MQWKNGYLGACIVVLGIIATIIGAYVLSIEVTDEEVTKYSYVADLNGLFDSEQAPSFIEYNPSTNYTGYYTDNSIVDGTKYFDGVYYDQSGMPNAYRLNMMPANYSEGTISTIPTTGTFSGEVRIWGYERTAALNTAYVWGTDESYNVHLSDLITALNLNPDQNLITLKSIDNKDAETWLYTSAADRDKTVNWVLFSADWRTGNIGEFVNFYSNEYNEAYSENRQLPLIACQVDLTNNQVKLYYDNECTEQAGLYNLSDVVVSFGSTTDNLSLGTSLNYVYQTKADVVYMDIRSGVSVDDGQ